MQKSKLERRDSLSIISDLLQNMKEPRRVTHLLYSSNMSYTQFMKYVKNLHKMGLVQEQMVPFHSYIITNEGKHFIEMVNKRNKQNKINFSD